MRDRQLRFDFSDGEDHMPEQPQCAQRRKAAAKILALQAHPAIRALIGRGQLAPGNHMTELPLVTFVRNERYALKRFVDCLANGGLARNEGHQTAACALLSRFDSLEDFALAMELKTLGLCDSTRSFGRPLGSSWASVLLWKFRKAMQKHEKAVAVQATS